MLCRLGEAGSTLGQWDGPGQCNLLLMSSSRLRSNQGLLKTHKSGSLYLPFDPCTFDCSSYLSRIQFLLATLTSCWGHFSATSLVGWLKALRWQKTAPFFSLC